MSFKREERYIVLKIKDLTDEDYDHIWGYILSEEVPLVEHCVVVESDWPEYEGVWESIERRTK